MAIERAGGEESGSEYRMASDALEDDLQEAGAATTGGVILVLLTAIVLVALPVAVALQGQGVLGHWVAVCLGGGFSLAVSGTKVTAMAWGVARQLRSASPAYALAENGD